MKKVININFQGRVIPIEETAYEMLQNYIGSLRRHFANEEGRDEIINDIESRIGELFDDKLKKGAACITDTDVEGIMNSMGRPEDFDREEEAPKAKSQWQGFTGVGGGPAFGGGFDYSKKRLYRDEEDKILGGVASGLAHYLNIDPAVIRILFALLTIVGGSGFLVYIVLWIVLPSRSLVNNIRKRLYRDTEDRVISGVCGGLGKYFDINPAIPRIIFAAPFIFGIITSIGRHFFAPEPVFVGSFGGGTFILAYIILWIVLPEAITTSEKLEMRGEKIDLNSIRNTVMSDLEGVKGRAQKIGEDIKESAQRFAGEAKENFGPAASNIASDTGRAFKRSGRGLGHAISVVIKAFVYFIGACIAFGLFIGLIALLGSGTVVLPLREFLLEGTSQNLFAWGTILLFLGIPVISIIVWFIRRLMRVNTHNKYLGYSFGVLWFVGLFCLIGLIGSLSRSFGSQAGKTEEIMIAQPASKLVITTGNSNVNFEDSWLEMDGLVGIDRDSIFLNTVRVNVVRSTDSNYHLHVVKISRGRDRAQSQQLAESITFPVAQRDSIIYLPETFTVNKDQKWRNQRVMIVVEVPVGKKIRIDNPVSEYDYFNVEIGRRRSYYDFRREWEDGMYWVSDKDMTMTADGLKWDEDLYRYNHPEKEEEQPMTNEKDGDQNGTDDPAAPAKPTPPAPKNEKTDTVYHYNGAFVPVPKADDNTVAISGTVNISKAVEKVQISNPLAMIFRM